MFKACERHEELIAGTMSIIESNLCTCESVLYVFSAVSLLRVPRTPDSALFHVVPNSFLNW